MAPDGSYRPELPDCGVYTHWPSSGTDWIHPADVATANALIPSRRIFERTHYDGTFYHLQYGDHHIRVRPTMWQPVRNLDVHIGDRVEILSDFGQSDPGIAQITDILADLRHDSVQFRLQQRDLLLPALFRRSQFRLLVPRFRLHESFYPHPPAHFRPPANIDMLIVDELT